MPPFDDYTSPPVTVATSNVSRNNSDFSSLSFPVVDHSRSRVTPASLQITRYSPNMRTPSPRNSPLKTATNSSKENSSRNLTALDPQATFSSQNFQSPHKKQFYDDFEFDESSIFAEMESSSEIQQRSNFERSPMRPYHGAGCVHSRQIVSRRCIHRNVNSIHNRNHQISSKSLPLKIQLQGANNNSLVVNSNGVHSNSRPNSTRSQAVAISSKSQKSSVQSSKISSSFVQPSTYTNCECFSNGKKEKSVRVPDNIPPPDQMFTVIQELNRQTYESKSELIFGELPSRTNQSSRHDDRDNLLDDYERGITSFATRRVAMDANMKRADNFSGLNFSFCGSPTQNR